MLSNPVYGTHNRKNTSGLVTLTGIEFENDPVPSSVPLFATCHLDKGVAILVEVTQTYPAFGVPPEPVTIKLPPDCFMVVTSGGVKVVVKAEPCRRCRPDQVL